MQNIKDVPTEALFREAQHILSELLLREMRACKSEARYPSKSGDDYDDFLSEKGANIAALRNLRADLEELATKD